MTRSWILLTFLLQPPTEVIHEPGLTARIARRLDSLITILQHALGVSERAFLLSRSRGGKQKYFRCDRIRRKFATLDLGRVIPERGSLCFDHVSNHQPLQLGESGTL